jgi:hypothetical protein
MRSSTYMALFASAVFAQDESATLLNFFMSDSTLTVLGSDASATTYGKSCSDNAGISAIPSDLRTSRYRFLGNIKPDNSQFLTALPRPTSTFRSRPRSSRRSSSSMLQRPWHVCAARPMLRVTTTLSASRIPSSRVPKRTRCTSRTQHRTHGQWTWRATGTAR